MNSYESSETNEIEPNSNAISIPEDQTHEEVITIDDEATIFSIKNILIGAVSLVFGVLFIVFSGTKRQHERVKEAASIECLSVPTNLNDTILCTLKEETANDETIYLYNIFASSSNGIANTIYNIINNTNYFSVPKKYPLRPKIYGKGNLIAFLSGEEASFPDGIKVFDLTNNGSYLKHFKFSKEQPLPFNAIPDYCFDTQNDRFLLTTPGNVFITNTPSGTIKSLIMKDVSILDSPTPINNDCILVYRKFGSTSSISLFDNESCGCQMLHEFVDPVNFVNMNYSEGTNRILIATGNKEFISMSFSRQLFQSFIYSIKGYDKINHVAMSKNGQYLFAVAEINGKSNENYLLLVDFSNRNPPILEVVCVLKKYSDSKIVDLKVI